MSTLVNESTGESESTGVSLRPWRPGDAAALGEPGPAEQGAEERAVLDAGTGEVLGRAGFTPRGAGVASIGLWIAPAARGRGVGSAALGRLSEELFEQFHRLYVEIEAPNLPAQRVAIAAGFTREGIARGGGRRPDGSRLDLVVWSRLDDDPAGPSPRALPDLPEGRLTDGVVTLRPLGPHDAAVTYELRIRPDVSGRSVVGGPLDLAVVERQCAESGGKWLAGLRAEMTVRRASDEAYLGEIALFYAEPLLREAMIGYALTPEARGHGYATRAARLITDWGFEIGMARMTAGTAVDNVASQRVLEAAGYHREAVQLARLPGPDGGRVDNVAFAKVRPAAT